MSEPITLEFLSKQLNCLSAELQDTHDDLRDIHAIMLRCVATARDVQDLLDECKSLLDEISCD